AGLPGAQLAAPPGQKQVLHAWIIAALAVVGWLAGVRPLEQRLSAKQAELTRVKAMLTEVEQGGANAAPPAGGIHPLAGRAGQARGVNAWTGSSGDASRLYDAFRALAAKSSVRIERVEPSASSRSPTPRARSGNSPEVFGYTIEITGTYPAVTAFIDACEQD